MAAKQDKSQSGVWKEVGEVQTNLSRLESWGSPTQATALIPQLSPSVIIAFVRLDRSNRMSILKVTTVGNSVGVILPKEILERLRVGKGDSLYVIETKQGIELTAYNPEFAAQVEVAERVMREDRDALKKLAE